MYVSPIMHTHTAKAAIPLSRMLIQPRKKILTPHDLPLLAHTGWRRRPFLVNGEPSILETQIREMCSFIFRFPSVMFGQL